MSTRSIAALAGVALIGAALVPAAAQTPAGPPAPMSYAECVRSMNALADNMEALIDRGRHNETIFFRTGLRDWYAKARADFNRDAAALDAENARIEALCRHHRRPAGSEPDGR